MKKLLVLITSVALFTGAALLAQESENLELVTSFIDQWDYATDIAIKDDYALVTTGNTGVQILDVSDPENMKVVGYFDPEREGNIQDIVVENDLICASYNRGVSVFRNTLLGVQNKDLKTILPGEIYMYLTFPNPFNSRATVSFTLPSAGNANLVVYDPLGRLVQEVTSVRWMSAGKYTATIDAADLPNGLYYIRLCADEKDSFRKITVLK